MMYIIKIIYGSNIYLKKLKYIYKKSYIFISNMEDNNTLNPNKVRKYQKSIEDYLNKTRVGPGGTIKYTHVAMGENFCGKFMLDKKQVKEFTKLYAEAVEYGLVFSIAEKPKDYGPLLIDLDLEIPLEDHNNIDRLYNDDMIYEVINVYREIACEYLDLDAEELSASVFEKPKPSRKATTIKDGVHIIFHGITAHYKLRYLIRHKVVQKLNDSKMFNKFVNSVDKIFDKQVVHTNSWLLPGSRKKDGQVYELKYIYDQNNNIVDITKILASKYKTIRLYSLQDKLRNEENASTYLENITFEDIEDEFSKIGDKHSRNNLNNVFENTEVSNNKEEDVNRAKFLVSLLSDERNNNFDSWIRIGWALHNIDNSLLSTWIEFSKKSSKFKDGDCENRWYTMRNEGVTIRSLMYWAEEDNYLKYHEYIKQEFNDILIKSIDGSSYYVAKALYSKYQNRFVYNSKVLSWFEFKNHKWFKIHDGYTLKLELSESFANEYLYMINKLNNKASKLSGSDKDDLIAKASKIQKIVASLMNITFKEKIMKEAIILFTDPNFDEKLDENYDLIGFNNGVYDLLNEEFREGRADDYISKSTNVDYYPFNESNPYVSKMFKFFKEILPIESVRNHMMLALSSCVAGHNKDEKLRITTGSGGNGKSLLFSLVQQALGEYYISCPITIITRKRNSSNQASPELLRIKGTRCGCFQETDDGEKLNVGMMKEITGGDSVMVRGLFADPIEIKPQIKFFLACNQLPELPSVDGGVKRRLENILFGSKFVDTPIKPNEFLIDNTLKQKIKDWAPTFASYLVHLYVTDYKKRSCLIAPSEVKLSTESYIAENDYYTDYFITRILYTGNKSDSLTISNMYDDFKLWYKNSRDNTSKAPPKVEFTKFIVEKIGENKNSRWRGFTFNNSERKDEYNSDDDNKCSLDI